MSKENKCKVYDFKCDVFYEKECLYFSESWMHGRCGYNEECTNRCQNKQAQIEAAKAFIKEQEQSDCSMQYFCQSDYRVLLSMNKRIEHLECEISFLKSELEGINNG